MKSDKAVYRYKNDLDKKYVLENDVTIATYSKRKFKQLYPKGQGGYHIIGAVGKGLKKNLSTFDYNGDTYPYYEYHYSRLRVDIESYIPVGDDTYLAVVKSRVMKNIGYAFLLLAIMCSLIALSFMVFNRTSGPPVDPNSSKYKIDLADNITSEPGTTSIPGYDDIKM